MDDLTIAEIAAGLTAAQKAWVLAMPDDEVFVSEDRYCASPPFFVQFTPDEYCPDTGIYLGGGKRHWFGAGWAGYFDGPRTWKYSERLNELGLAVRAYLQEQNG